MKKEIKKLTKQEKEKIENRLLAIFAVALGAVMLLLYLNNWFQGQAGFMTAARILIYSFMVGGIAGSILLGIFSKRFRKQGQIERAVKYKNWFWVVLTIAIASFVVYPTEIISKLFGWVGLAQVGLNIVVFINRARFARSAISDRIFVIMGAVGVYTVAAFIYYGIKTRRAYKASLNKGKK